LKIGTSRESMDSSSAKRSVGALTTTLGAGTGAGSSLKRGSRANQIGYANVIGG